MKQKLVYDRIREWEIDAGESFADYFESNVNISNFMFWCLGRGYLDVIKFQLWEDAKSDNDCFADFLTVVIDGGEEYSLVIDTEWEKGEMILAEFISESITYTHRFNQFMSDWNREDEE